jgi:hypothetical protein
MKRWHVVALAIATLALGFAAVAAAGGNTSLGLGVHYWKTLDTIEIQDVEIDESGLSWVGSLRLDASALVKFQLDVEMFPEKFGGTDEPVYAPAALLLVGPSIYGGIGIGTYYYKGEFAEEPFYLLRAGLDLDLLPMLSLDINANYRWEDWKDLGDVVEDLDTDTITLGAGIRLTF